MRVEARYPSGKGEVCKTFMRRFDSDPRLQPVFAHPRRTSQFVVLAECVLTNAAAYPICSESNQTLLLILSAKRRENFRLGWICLRSRFDLRITGLHV